jgi:uncharacterized protein (DUF1330 family)
MHIKPTREQVMELANSELSGPVVMLNLLKFAQTAGGGAPEGTGADSYKRYGEELRSILERTGARLLWQGRADSVVIGDDEADGWDAVLLVEYPSRKAFIEMTSSKEYEGVGKHRTNALADSRLIAMTEQFRRKD